MKRSNSAEEKNRIISEVFRAEDAYDGDMPMTNCQSIHET
jgi:hypothetical protein